MEKKKRNLIIISIVVTIILVSALFIIVSKRIIFDYILPIVNEYIEETKIDKELIEVRQMRQNGKYELALFKLDELTDKYQHSEIYNEKGYILIILRRHNEGIEALKKAIEIDPENDSPYNNLSWAYYELQEYEKSLEYINKSLSMKTNSSNEYGNKGNALYGLEKYTEAIKSYDRAIEINNKNSYAYYGKGLCYYEKGDYDKAVFNINRSNDIDKEIDESDLFYILHSFKQLNKDDRTKNYVEVFLASRQSDYEAMKLLANTFEMIESYDNALEYYIKAEKRLLVKKGLKNYDEYIVNPDEDFKEYLELLENIGYIHYCLSNYNESLNYFNKVIHVYPQSTNSKLWNVFNLLYLKKYDSAETLAEVIIKENPDNEVAYNTLGNVYMEQFEYDKAIEQFEKAINIDPYYEDAYINKLYCLFYDKQYKECIEYGNVTLKIFPNNLDAHWYLADSYSSIYEEESAIENYKKALEISPNNEILFMRLAWEYFGLQDYENSKIFVDKTLEINSDNSEAIELEKAIDERIKPLKDRVVEFVEENYLYIKDVKNLKEKIDKFKSNTKVTSKDIDEFINDIKTDEDRFTFVIRDTDYDMYLEYEDVESVYGTWLDANYYYIAISTFNNNTYAEFRSIIDSIENPRETKLIIDLRSNGGGMIRAANDILDIFLPEGQMSRVIDGAGEEYIYSSNSTSIEFEEIYVSVDKNSASGSELLALGLKKNLDNVKLIGETTVGKGVGQRVFIDMENKVVIYLVGFYWDIQGINVLEKGVEPDVYVDYSNGESYFEDVFSFE